MIEATKIIGSVRTSGMDKDDELVRELCDWTQKALFELEPYEVKALLQRCSQDVRELHDADSLPEVNISSDIDFNNYESR